MECGNLLPLSPVATCRERLSEGATPGRGITKRRQVAALQTNPSARVYAFGNREPQRRTFQQNA